MDWLVHEPRHLPVGDAAESDEDAETNDTKSVTTKANFSFTEFIECDLSIAGVVLGAHDLRAEHSQTNSRLIAQQKSRVEFGRFDAAELDYPADRCDRSL